MWRSKWDKPAVLREGQRGNHMRQQWWQGGERKEGAAEEQKRAGGSKRRAPRTTRAEGVRPLLLGYGLLAVAIRPQHILCCQAPQAKEAPGKGGRGSSRPRWSVLRTNTKWLCPRSKMVYKRIKNINNAIQTPSHFDLQAPIESRAVLFPSPYSSADLQHHVASLQCQKLSRT